MESVSEDDFFVQDGKASWGERPHRKLIVWQKGIELVEAIYKLTVLFPIEERFVLTSQLRRASISIPSNIAEGAARNTNKEKINFFHIARGSLSEVDTQMEIVRRLGYCTLEQHSVIQELMGHLMALLNGLIGSFKEKI